MPLFLLFQRLTFRVKHEVQSFETCWSDMHWQVLRSKRGCEADLGFLSSTARKMRTGNVTYLLGVVTSWECPKSCGSRGASVHLSAECTSELLCWILQFPMPRRFSKGNASWSSRFFPRGWLEEPGWTGKPVKCLAASEVQLPCSPWSPSRYGLVPPRLFCELVKHSNVAEGNTAFSSVFVSWAVQGSSVGLWQYLVSSSTSAGRHELEDSLRMRKQCRTVPSPLPHQYWTSGETLVLVFGRLSFSDFAVRKRWSMSVPNKVTALSPIKN